MQLQFDIVGCNLFLDMIVAFNVTKAMDNDSPHPIRAYRMRCSPPLKQEDLAARIGTTKGNLSRIETGKQPVSESLLIRLVEETGIAASVLRPDLAKLFAGKELQ